MTGSSERCGGNKGWRANLFERIGVAIERQLAQRSRHRGAQTALQRKHRTAELGAAFVIENAQRRCCFPVRHTLMLRERSGHIDGPFDHGIVVLASAIRGGSVRHVCDAQQHIVQRRRQLVALGGKAALALAKLAACGHGSLGRLRIACFARKPSCFAEVVHLAPMFVALGGDIA